MILPRIKWLFPPPDGVDFVGSGWEPRATVNQMTYATDGADLGLIPSLQWADVGPIRGV